MVKVKAKETDQSCERHDPHLEVSFSLFSFRDWELPRHHEWCMWEIHRQIQSRVPAPEEWVEMTSGLSPCGKSTVKFKVELPHLKSG